MKITKVKGYVLSSPYGNGKVLGQPLGVKSIGLVEVHTDEGLTGLGETYSGIYVPELIEPIVDFLGKKIIGMNPCQPEEIIHEINIPFVSRNGLIQNIYSAIDIALWDIKSQFANQPLYKILQLESVTNKRVYASGGSAAYQPEQLKQDIEKVVSLGFNSYKMRVGYQSWEQDLERVAVARDTLGTDKLLMIDAIMGSVNPPWSLEIAYQRICDLKPYLPYWIEEPLHPNDLLSLINLHQKSPIKIATGEALSGTLEYASYLSSKAADFIQLDVTHCGGITQGMKILQMAKKAGIPVTMHVWGSGIALAANTHFAFASNEVEWLEIPMVDLQITSEMEMAKPTIQDGFMEPPTSVGLGIFIKNAIKEKYPFIQESGFKL